MTSLVWQTDWPVSSDTKNSSNLICVLFFFYSALQIPPPRVPLGLFPDVLRWGFGCFGHCAALVDATGSDSLIWALVLLREQKAEVTEQPACQESGYLWVTEYVDHCVQKNVHCWGRLPSFTAKSRRTVRERPCWTRSVWACWCERGCSFATNHSKYVMAIVNSWSTTHRPEHRHFFHP